MVQMSNHRGDVKYPSLGSPWAGKSLNLCDSWKVLWWENRVTSSLASACSWLHAEERIPPLGDFYLHLVYGYGVGERARSFTTFSSYKENSSQMGFKAWLRQYKKRTLLSLAKNTSCPWQYFLGESTQDASVNWNRAQAAWRQDLLLSPTSVFLFP